MNILVTGSSGFIASHLIPKLEGLGHDVITMDIKTIGDVRSKEQCLDFTEDMDYVIHLAALTDVQESIRELRLSNFNYYDTNLSGVVKMLNASVKNGVKRFIFASSAAAQNPQSPYGTTKLCGESWCEVFNQCYGLSTISLRFFNVYGIGTNRGVIPTWINQIRQGKRPVIYGGNQIRDFIYVKDVVEAIVCAINSPAVGMCEVGTGRGIAIFDLAQEILSAMKSDLKIIPEERKEGEVQESIARHMAHTLNWIGFKAQYTLKQGLGEMLK